MTNRKIVLGNWKTNKNVADVKAFFSTLNQAGDLPKNVIFGVAPVFVHLPMALQLKNAQTIVVAQDCNPHSSGAFTGSVSYSQLKDLEVNHVIVGHSERRTLYHETDADINLKVIALLNAGLTPVLCVGESLQEYDAKQTKIVCTQQIKAALTGIDAALLPNLIVAYEPVWAIGTGRTATENDVVVAISAIRDAIAASANTATANATPVLYGGSVKPDNARTIMGWPGVDGVLVGGASLDPNDFIRLVKAGA